MFRNGLLAISLVSVSTYAGYGIERAKWSGDFEIGKVTLTQRQHISINHTRVAQNGAMLGRSGRRERIFNSMVRRLKTYIQYLMRRTSVHASPHICP